MRNLNPFSINVPLLYSLKTHFYAHRFLTVFARHDIRDDLKKFLDEHDKRDRQRSERRFSKLPEKERQRQSMRYRRASVKRAVSAPTGGKINEDEDVELKGKKMSLPALEVMNEANGITNIADDKQEE